MMQTINIHDAKTQLSRYVDQVSQGETIVIARAGKPVARLVPLAAVQSARQLGLGAARYTLPIDFDSIHNDEIVSMFESSLSA